ncbi:MAG: LamG-like jellyroll fold domain-containing protein, partial [Candidatus Bathyarchaeia archaeon]
MINENIIYAVGFGSPRVGFGRFIIPENRWENLGRLPAPISNANDRLVFDGTFLYMIRAYEDNSFWRYAPAWWENLSPWPGIVGSTVACYAENILSGKRYIYALESKSDPAWLYRYDIATGVWENLGTKPGVGTAAGSSMVWTGGRYLYVLRGGTTTAPNFYRYDIVENSWTTLAPTGTSQLSGSCLAWDGGDNIYAAIRSTSPADNFLKVYKISTNTWENIIMLPENAAGGSSICKVENFIYYQVGGTKRYWRYSIVDNSWSRLADVPESSGAGGSQEKVGDKYIYFVVGGGSENVYRFVISENRWENVSSFPATVTNANDRLAFDGTYLYMIRGATDSSFWRYSVKTIPAYSLKWQQTIPLTLYESPEQTYAQPYSLSLLAGGVTSLDNIKFADDKPASFSQRRYIYVYENKGRGTENTTSTSFVDLENARVSVSVIDNSYLIINFHAAHNSSMAGDNVEFRIMVGTYVVARGHSQMGVASQDTTISLTRAWRVPPGNYTVRAQWKRASGSGTLWCWERSLSVMVVPAYWVVRDSKATDWVTTTSSDFVDIPNMASTVTVTENSYLLVNFHISHNVDHSSGDGKAEFQIQVGTENIAMGYSNSPWKENITLSLTGIQFVTPGTYTVKARWRSVNGYTLGAWERSLNVVAIPTRALKVENIRSTTTTSTTSSDWTPLPNASLSISVPENVVLAINFHAGFNNNTSGAKPQFRIILDGDNNNPLAMGYSRMAMDNQDTTFRLVAAVPVSAGSHTIDVQWRIENGIGIAYCWERSLNVVALENLFDFELLGEISNIPLADRYTLEMKYRLSSDSDGFVVYVKSPQPLVTDNTVALWRFDEGRGVQVLDSSGNGQTGLIYGRGPRWVGGKFGYALRFENTGNPQYVEIPYSPSLALGKNFFIELWVKPERDYPDGAPKNRWYIFAWQDKPGGGERWVIGYQTWDNAIEFKVMNEDSVGFSAKYPTRLEAGKWYHIAGVKQGSKLKLYIDGILVAQTTFFGTIAPAGKMYISWKEIQPWVDTFSGLIDEVRLENRAPLGTENVLLYNDSGFPTTPYVYTWSENGKASYDANSTEVVPPEGSKSFMTYTGSDNWAGWGIFYEIIIENVVDSSGRNNHGTPYNVTGEIGKLGTALRFNGTNAYVSVPNSASLNPTRVTVEAWAYFVEQPAENSRQVVVSKFEGAINNSKGYELYIETDENGQFKIVFNVGPGRWEWGSFAEYPTTFQTGWHHLVGTFDGSYLRLYYDGSLVATEPWTGNIASNTRPLCVGRKAEGDWGFFKGIIDEVRVEN